MVVKKMLAQLMEHLNDDEEDSDPVAAALPQVLLVEDNMGDVHLTRHMLRGYCTLTDVPRLSDALDLIDEEVFDLILLDLNLLDIEGPASVAAINAVAPNIPIIVYSGVCDGELRNESVLCGARCCLIKGQENRFTLKTAIQKMLTHAQI